MAGFLGSSWPIPFVVPPCTQPADFAQPPQGAERFRDGLAASRPSFPDRGGDESFGLFSSPIALGGYRPGGCQVAEKPANCGRMPVEHLHRYDRRTARQPTFLNTQFAGDRSDQALALLSTARSERSA